MSIPVESDVDRRTEDLPELYAWLAEISVTIQGAAGRQVRRALNNLPTNELTGFLWRLGIASVITMTGCAGPSDGNATNARFQTIEACMAAHKAGDSKEVLDQTRRDFPIGSRVATIMDTDQGVFIVVEVFVGHDENPYLSVLREGERTDSDPLHMAACEFTVIN